MAENTTLWKWGNQQKYHAEIKEELDKKINIADIPKTTEVMNTSEVSNLITITDAAADTSLISLTAYGKSTQGYASHGGEPLGKNLFDFTAWKNGITGISNGTAEYTQNSITLTAIADDCFTSADDALGSMCNFSVKPNTTYVLSWTANNDNDGQVLVFLNRNINDLIYEHNNYFKSFAFTTKDDTTFISIRFGVANAGESITYSNIQLEEGSVVTDYEPYYSNPNPDCPVPIESVGDSGSLKLTTCGKNLLHHNARNMTVNGITVIANEDKSISLSGINIETSVYVTTLSTKLLPVGSYTLCGGNVAKIIAQVTDNKGGRIWAVSHQYMRDYPFNITENTASIQVYIEVDKGVEVNDTIYPMIVKSGESTDYEPYKSTTAIITTALPLRGIPVSNGGNYIDSNGQDWICDELVVRADGTGKITKRIAMFDNFVLRENLTNCSVYNSTIENPVIAKQKGANYFKCTHTNTYSYDEVDTVHLYLSGNDAVVFLPLECDIDDLGVVGVYETPAETELTAEQTAFFVSLTTFDNITNIFNSDNANMYVKYWCDDSMSALISTKANVSDILPIAGGTMQGTLVAQTNTDYTNPQVRNVSMSTEAAIGGNNGQIHFQYV